MCCCGGLLGDLETPDSARVLALQDWFEGERRDRKLSEIQTRVLRYILLDFASVGTPPSLDALREDVGLTREEVADCLATLNQVDAIYVDPASGALEAAYPFSTCPTPFRLTYYFDGQYRSAYAMCAIDVLGIPFMLDTSAEINSRCGHCDEQIELTVSGGAITTSDNWETVVFVSLSHCHEHAATTLCRDILFFSSPAHFQAWREQNKMVGAVLSLSEALYVAKGIFEDRLRATDAKEQQARPEPSQPQTRQS